MPRRSFAPDETIIACPSTLVDPPRRAMNLVSPEATRVEALERASAVPTESRWRAINSSAVSFLFCADAGYEQIEEWKQKINDDRAIIDKQRWRIVLLIFRPSL